jgi:hypothetical protein
MQRLFALDEFSVSFVLTFESPGIAISIRMQVFSFLSSSIISGRFASTVRSVIKRHVPHNSGTFDIYDPFRCTFVVLVSNL